MSLLGSLLAGLFGKKKPKQQPSKRSASPKKATPKKAKTKKSTAKTNGPVKVLDPKPAKRYSVPKSPTPQQLADRSRKLWVTPGETTRVAGRSIPGGMIYVGSDLESVTGWRGIEPALVDPKLPVAKQNPDTRGTYLPYWPKYAELTPTSRAAFLDWLAAGRPAGVPIGYVFLFFYGIERRVLFDAKYDAAARREIPTLVAEVERLRRLYPDERSFTAYTTDFLVAAQMMQGAVDPRQIEPPILRSSWELPLATRVAVGTLAANRQPIPPIWALSWVSCDPETRLRKPAKRCREEFATMFRVAYQRKYGEGLVLEVPKKVFEPVYRPASSGFSAPVSLGSHGIPDISASRQPLTDLRKLLDQISDDLDEYSRALGSRGGEPSITALAYLPTEFGNIDRIPAVASLAMALENALQGVNATLVDRGSLLRYFSDIHGTPTVKQTNGISRLIRRLGYRLEPDPETERKPFLTSDKIGLYRLFESDGTAESDVNGALNMLSIAVAIAAADGVITEQESHSIMDQITHAYSLDAASAARLRARLLWLETRPPTLASIRRRLSQLTPPQAVRTLRLSLAIATVNSVPNRATVERLMQVYRALGIDEQRLHADLHEWSTGWNAGRAAPVAQPRTQSENIRLEDQSKSTLDAQHLQSVLQQTREISALLNEVFTDDEDSEALLTELDADSSYVEDETIENDPYLQLVRFLAERPNWELTEVAAMASSLGLMVSGAIETINDRAMAKGLDPLLECDETCEIYEPTLKEFLAYV